MATYAIGDVQGCARTFRRLLDRIGFEASVRNDDGINWTLLGLELT